MKRAALLAAVLLSLAVLPADAHHRPEHQSCVTPSPAPTPEPSPWTLAFSDDFTTWDDSRYFVYGDPEDGAGGWTNKYTGFYDPTIISSDGSLLRVHLHTRDGKPRIAAFVPIPEGSFGRGDLDGMRVEFRIRADRMPGYLGVPLLWPWDRDNNPATEEWPYWGEIDSPDSPFDVQPKAHIHLQGGTWAGDQDSYLTPAGTSWEDWNVYVTEYIPGVRAEVFINGASFGRTTERVPEGPMHFVGQMETLLNFTPPDPTVSGYVEWDYIKVWRRS